jgi:hypothetical protein
MKLWTTSPRRGEKLARPVHKLGITGKCLWTSRNRLQTGMAIGILSLYRTEVRRIEERYKTRSERDLRETGQRGWQPFGEVTGLLSFRG